MEEESSKLDMMEEDKMGLPYYRRMGVAGCQ